MKLRRVIMLLATAGVLAAGYALFTGPHMLVQPHIRAYQAVMPTLPPGVVTVEQPATLPSAADAKGMVNPLLVNGRATPADIARGRTYYEYYCLSCHGDTGRGDGPVGDSFTPRPASLDTQRIGEYSDGELLRQMLLSPGHWVQGEQRGERSVLQYTVKSEHQWYLVLYVRSLGKQTGN